MKSDSNYQVWMEASSGLFQQDIVLNHRLTADFYSVNISFRPLSVLHKSIINDGFEHALLMSSLIQLWSLEEHAMKLAAQEMRKCQLFFTISPLVLHRIERELIDVIHRLKKNNIELIVELDATRILKLQSLRDLRDLVEQGVVFSLGGLNEKSPQSCWLPSALCRFVRVGPPPINSEGMRGFLECCLLLSERYGSHLVVDKIECKEQHINSHNIPFYGLLGDFLSKPLPLDRVCIKERKHTLLM